MKGRRGTLGSGVRLAFATALAGGTLFGQVAQAKLESLAPLFPYFCAESFFLDHQGCWFGPETDYRALVAELAAAPGTVAELVGLLDHADPKVRTLAIAVLFAREDPKVLPHLAAKVDDAAPTFPTVLPEALMTGTLVKRLPRLENRTVGQIAEQAVRLYLEAAGFFGGVRGPHGHPGFAEYWAARKDRAFCAGWFLVQLARASQRTSPTPPERRARILDVRKRIDRLPEHDRAWTLLWLNGEEGSDVLVSEEELLRACRRLGPERLMQMLERKMPSSDPDLQPRDNNNYPYARMSRWVLERAGRLLRKPDAEALLECERRERQSGFADPNLTAQWAIAAAELRPEHAPKILPEALSRFQADYQGHERAALTAAIWRRVGPSQLEFLRDWFYNESPRRGEIPHSRAQFLRLVSGRDARGSRALLAGLIADERLDSLDWQSLAELVQAVSAITPQPPVPAAEMEKAKHPVGVAHFHWERESAAARYPRETEALMKLLAGWRERLRATLPQLKAGP